MRNKLTFKERWVLSEKLDYQKWTEENLKKSKNNLEYHISSESIEKWWNENNIPMYEDEVDNFLKKQ